jgi:hypothetical protein
MGILAAKANVYVPDWEAKMARRRFQDFARPLVVDKDPREDVLNWYVL